MKKRTLANLTKWPASILANFKKLLKGGTVVQSLENSFDVIRSRPHRHVAAVLGALRKLGLDKVIDRMLSKNRDLINAMIVVLVSNYGSTFLWH